MADRDQIIELKDQNSADIAERESKRKPEIKFFHPYNFMLFVVSMFVFVPVVFHRMAPDLPGFLTVFPAGIAFTLVFFGYLIVSGIAVILLKIYFSRGRNR